ncbi:MAG: alginate lyase family protein [Povalibacter sp.]
MPSLSWYVNRLGRMSAGEVLHRLTQVAQSTTDQWTSTRASEVPAPTMSVATAQFVHSDATIDPAIYLQRADEYLRDEFSFFALEGCHLGNPPQWNRDPLTGRLAPQQRAATLDYRDEHLVGNIKYLWEPNRHLHLPTLAQAYALTGETRFLHALRDHLDSWIKQCPYGVGANWTSSLELAIRLINWSIAWQLIGGASSPIFEGVSGRAFQKRWLDSVFLHARGIMKKLSRYSSANNHLIGEVAGVWVASVTWDYWAQMRVWGERAKQILTDEAFTQNAADGGNREQATSYQQFVLDFLLIAGLAARAAERDFVPEYWGRIEAMMTFIASLMDVAGHMPMIGDADDGYVVDLAAQGGGFDNFQSLLATGAVLFNRPDFARKARRLDDKTRWLLGRQSDARWSALVAAESAVSLPRAFANSGYYILGDRLDTPEEVRMLVDAGPLGYLSIAAHGHADALSCLLNIAGREVLIDPGTYAYHTQPDWRRYFRSTRAHNTVSVDGLDQSRQSGNFMWSLHARSRCEVFEVNSNSQRFVGSHDGYRQQGTAVTHRRTIVYDAIRRTFEIEDAIEGEGAHEIARHWHFAEDLDPRVEDNAVIVDVGRMTVRLVAGEADTQSASYRGGDAQQGGWVSRRFDRKSPSTGVRWINRVVAPVVLRTRIDILDRGLDR